MTGVYERALGSAAATLHPRVRERYALGPEDDTVCVGRGRIDVTRGSLALPALYVMPVQNLLFPESGRDVPFSVTTAGLRTEAGHEALLTRRAFDFGDVTRRFDSLTVWDDAHDRLFDFLGRDGLLASVLRPRVADGALVVEGGRQWFRLGGRYVPIPGPLAAGVTVRDRYDDGDARFHVDATVTNPIVGRILGYRGTFTQECETPGRRGDALRPSHTPARFPPA